LTLQPADSSLPAFWFQKLIETGIIRIWQPEPPSRKDVRSQGVAPVAQIKYPILALCPPESDHCHWSLILLFQCLWSFSGEHGARMDDFLWCKWWNTLASHILSGRWLWLLNMDNSSVNP
jgi:hypothetical protein